MAKQPENKRFSLNKEDLKSIGVTLGIAVASLVVTQLIDLIPQIDFGSNSEVIIAVLMVLLKAAQRFVNGK